MSKDEIVLGYLIIDKHPFLFGKVTLDKTNLVSYVKVNLSNTI